MSFDPVSYVLGLRGGIGRDIVSSLMGRIKGGGGGGSTDTELDFTLTSDLTQHLYLTQSAPGAVTVDWGDGSPPESPSDLAASLSHTRAEAGNYTVRISCAAGETWSPGLVSGSDKYGIIGKYTTKTDTYPTLTSARLGAGARLNVGYAFTQCTGLASIAMTEDITAIPANAFNKCTGLTSVTIPNSVTSIGANAFNGCSGLTGVYIEDLGAWCGINFGNESANPCSNAHYLYLNGTLLTSVTIPSNVTSIGQYAFSTCTGLTSVTIPNSVTSIGNYAFHNCSHVHEITSNPTIPPALGEGAITGVPADCAIYVPSTSVAAYQAETGWSDRAAYIQAIAA